MQSPKESLDEIIDEMLINDEIEAMFENNKDKELISQIIAEFDAFTDRLKYELLKTVHKRIFGSIEELNSICSIVQIYINLNDKETYNNKVYNEFKCARIKIKFLFAYHINEFGLTFDKF